MLFLGGKGATGEVQTTIALLRTGDKDAGRGGGVVGQVIKMLVVVVVVLSDR